jgi:hypothetical protein
VLSQQFGLEHTKVREKDTLSAFFRCFKLAPKDGLPTSIDRKFSVEKDLNAVIGMMGEIILETKSH